MQDDKPATPGRSKKQKRSNPVNSIGPRRKPDFYGVGAEKCGTTWLWQMFHDHPEIGVTMPKELRYFAQLYLGTGFSNFSALNRLLKKKTKSPPTPAYLEQLATELRILYGRDQAYLRVFGAMSEPFVGDISPQYCMLPEEGIEHMHRISPNARILFMLRDPVDRVISAAKMKAGEDGSDLTQEQIAVKARVPFQISMSRYSTQIERFEAVFGADKVFIGFMDDVIERPNGLLEDVCNFLGVGFDPDFFSRLNLIANKGRKFEVDTQLRRELFAEMRDEYELLARRFPGRVDKWQSNHGL